MLVEDVKKAITETPEEKEGDDQGEGEDQSAASKVATSDRRAADWNTATHCS